MPTGHYVKLWCSLSSRQTKQVIPCLECLIVQLQLNGPFDVNMNEEWQVELAEKNIETEVTYMYMCISAVYISGVKLTRLTNVTARAGEDVANTSGVELMMF